MNGERLFPALLQLIIVSIIIVVAVTSVIDKRAFIGPVVFALGFLPWAPLSSSMGKMSGCLLGAGATLTLAWTIF